ncbi:hypothetical protein PQX77_004079 [Marasmius sp. AFHP31]|nr:hypothetical protein PQX77_004079 [Marasmius sp. AFHP31]
MTAPADPWGPPSAPRNENVPTSFSSTAWRAPDRRQNTESWYDPKRNVYPDRRKETRGHARDSNGWGDGDGHWDNPSGEPSWGRDLDDDPWGIRRSNDQGRGRRERRDTWAGREAGREARDWALHRQPQGQGWGPLDEEEDEDGGWEHVNHNIGRGGSGGGDAGGGWWNKAERSRSRGPPAHQSQNAWENDMDSIPHWGQQSNRPWATMNDDDEEDQIHARSVMDRMRASTPHIPHRNGHGHHRSKSRPRESGTSWGEGGSWGWGEKHLEDQVNDVHLDRLRAMDSEEKRLRKDRAKQREREAMANYGWGDANEEEFHRGHEVGGDWELAGAMNGLSLNGHGHGHHSPLQEQEKIHIHKKHKKRSRSLSAHRNSLFDGRHVTYEQYKMKNGVGGPRQEDLPFRPSSWREGYSVRSGGSGLGKGWFGGSRRASEVKEINDPVKRTLHPHLHFTPPSGNYAFSPYSSQSSEPPPVSLDLRISPSLSQSLVHFLPNIHFLTLPRNPDPTPNPIDLMQFATHPPTSQMRLFHRRLPWYIDIIAGMGGRYGAQGGGGSFVTIWDVIVGLYNGLTGGEGWGGESQVRAEEYWSGEMGDHVDASPPPPTAGNLPGSTPLLGTNMGLGRKMKRTAREQVSMSWRLRGQLANQVKYAQIMAESRMEDIAMAEGARAEQTELQRGVRRVDWLSVGAYVGTGGDGMADMRAFRWLGLKRAKRGMWEIVTEL